MPTPVDVARQCLAKEAAAALDDAIALVKRRNHAQTTSLHVVSALLALPSSLLRDACARSRNVAYPQRLQFRALQLYVGVALDRISVSKTPGDEPPVSNSLMAAIKRSQANQRRHPETYLLYQQQLNSNPDIPPSISAVKVELKHFVMSILDDPIVSRVFGDAGFQTQEMKFTVMSPPPVCRFMSTISRPLPQFLCSLSDYKQIKFTSNLPFISEDGGDGKAGGNTKRISEVLLKPTRRNPLLIGACAGDAYTNFLDSLKMGEAGILPKEVEGLNLVSLEHEVLEFLSGRLSDATLELKLRQFDETMENRQGHGIVAHCGDLIALVNAECADLVSYLVTRLKKSLLNSCRKSWLIGFIAGDDVYKKLLKRVPSLETDWDLNLLPITSSAIGGKCSNSGLLGAYFPFEGFFSTHSELETSRSNATLPLELCDWCIEKYEQEVSAVRKVELMDAAIDKQLENPSSWLQIGKISNALEIKEGKSELGSRVAGLQRKWTDICRKFHAFQKSGGGISPSGSVAPSLKKFPFSKNCERVEDASDRSSSWPLESHQNIAAQNVDLNDNQQSTQMPIVSTCSTHVATDLRLGTNHGFPDESPRKRKLREGYRERSDDQVTHLSFFSGHLDKQAFGKELKGPWNALAEKVYWQIDAIQAVFRAVSRWRHEENKGCLWFTFLGPDKVGKLKTAALLSEIMFGPSANFVCLDLNMENAVRSSDSIIDRYHSKLQSVEPGRKLVVDCIAEDLRKHPNSVVFLENVDKADILIQESLSLAIKTRKFQDSCGRIINIQDTIFVLESSILKTSTEKDTVGEVAPEFPMEKVLQSRNLQMQLSVGATISSMSKKNYASNVWITGNDSQRSPVNKRKMLTHDELTWKRSHELSGSHIDLNIPVVNTELDMSADAGDFLGSPNDSEPSSSSLTWLQDLLEHVEDNVVFKSFDFDSAAREVVWSIDQLLNQDGVCLEIDEQVMCQMLAASWLAEDMKAIEFWIEQVLHPSIREAKRRCSWSSSSGTEMVMKLEHHLHGSATEEHAGELCLPPRIKIISSV